MVEEDLEIQNSAEKVIQLYEHRLAQMDVVIQNKELPAGQKKKLEIVDLGNLYCFMYAGSNHSKTTPELAKKLLLDQCFYEIQGKRIEEATGDRRILTKLEDGLKVRLTKPQRGIQLSGVDMLAISQIKEEFV